MRLKIISGKNQIKEYLVFDFTYGYIIYQTKVRIKIKGLTVG